MTSPSTVLARVGRGVVAAVRSRPKTFTVVALGVFLLNLLLPLAVLSVARRPVDHFTFNPWLSRLPEYLISHQDPWSKKLAFLTDLALAWFIAENPIEGVEWGFIIDVPSITRFSATSFLFGAYFVLWAHDRDRARHRGCGPTLGRSGGLLGAVVSVGGFSTGACSVMGCGVPVLPVVGLALTGVSSGMLTFLRDLAWVSTAVVLTIMTAAVAWLAWHAGAAPGEGPTRG